MKLKLSKLDRIKLKKALENREEVKFSDGERDVILKNAEVIKYNFLQKVSRYCSRCL